MVDVKPITLIFAFGGSKYIVPEGKAVNKV